MKNENLSQLKKIKEIEKINGFITKPEEIIWSSNKVYLNSNVITEGDIQLIRQKEGRIYIQKSNTSELIDSATLAKYSLPYVGDLIHKEILLYATYNESYTKMNVFAVNFVTQKELWSMEDGIGQIYFEKDNLFGHINSSITKYNQQDGTKLWDVNLHNYGSYSINGESKKIDLQEFIGIHNSLLYIKAGSNLILGINLVSGQIEFECKYYQDYLVLDNLRIDKIKNCIFSIGPRHYIEFDLANSIFELTDLTEQITKYQIETTRLGGWDRNQLYFWEGSTNNKFGEFSRQNKKINWCKTIDEIEGEFPAIKSVNYGKGKLYINDFRNKLHIYEL